MTGVDVLLSGAGTPPTLLVEAMRSEPYTVSLMSGAERTHTIHQLVLTDGGKRCVARLQTQLNELIESGRLRAGAQIRVDRWFVTTDKDVSLQDIRVVE